MVARLYKALSRSLVPEETRFHLREDREETLPISGELSFKEMYTHYEDEEAGMYVKKSER